MNFSKMTDKQLGYLSERHPESPFFIFLKESKGRSFFIKKGGIVRDLDKWEVFEMGCRNLKDVRKMNIQMIRTGR